MSTIAAIQVDLEVTIFGTRSRLADEIHGETILHRTIHRVRQCRSIEKIYVLAPRQQAERCASLLRNTEACIQPFEGMAGAWSALVRTARKWSLDGWRGGLGQTTYFDEFVDLPVLGELLKTVKADTVLCVPSAAPCFDPQVGDRMLEQLAAGNDDFRLTFTQAPPGVAGIVLATSLIHEMAAKNAPIGWAFSYQPDCPRKDLIFQPCLCEIPAELRYASGRLVADTDRSLRRVHALLDDHPSPDASTIGQWLLHREQSWMEARPHEVEIELTTDDPYPECLLRPRGSRIPHRGPLGIRVLDKVIEELAADDDALVVLGGFGDPLRHPQFDALLRRIHMARKNHLNQNLFGLAVRTTGVDLTDEKIDALIECRVDVLNVLLDAWSEEMYARLQSPVSPERATLEAVLARLNRLTERMREAKTVAPILVPEMTKCRENADELDAFYDGWIRRVGAVTISGSSHYGRRLDDRSVIRMSPPTRSPCRRMQSRCVVLADGSVTLCDQDFEGAFPIGNVKSQTLTEIWRGAAFQQVRTAHKEHQFDVNSLCAVCDEWHRP